jgi:hypothetical protein
MLKNIPTEAQMAEDDLTDPILKLIDEDKISTQELLTLLNLPSLPEDLDKVAISESLSIPPIPME